MGHVIPFLMPAVAGALAGVAGAALVGLWAPSRLVGPAGATLFPMTMWF
ncbi:MAG: hypothetical protein Kow0013_14260 [Pararhodobacter sp.]